MNAAVRVPGYEVLDVVGRGGHATVYRARQTAFDRIVALKVLTGLDVDGSAQRRFERECRAAGALSWHLHIVAVHDAGTTAEGAPYIAMEFFEDGSFADRVSASGPLSPAHVATIAVQLCGALETAHRAGTLHRDVKPENVLIGPYGEAKLGDFGIATLQAGDTVTATGVVTATVAHAPPEVLSGMKATEASDVYALGSTMFALLMGRPAFIEPTDEMLATAVARILTAPVPDLRAHGVPDELAGLVEWAMAKEPAERPRSAEELGAAVQAFQDAAGLPVADMRLRASPGDTLDAADTVTIAGPPRAPATAPTPVPTTEAEAPELAAPRAARRIPVRALVLLGALLAGAGIAALAVRGGPSSSSSSTSTTSTSTSTTVVLADLKDPVVVSGSTTVEPITRLNVEKFVQEAPDVTVSLGANGTGPGFQVFCADPGPNVNDASRPITAEEASACETAGIQFIELLIARDAVGRPQFIYVNRAHAEVNRTLAAFVDFYLSDAGLASVAEAELVPLTNAEIEETRRVWDERETGTRHG